MVESNNIRNEMGKYKNVSAVGGTDRKSLKVRQKGNKL